MSRLTNHIAPAELTVIGTAILVAALAEATGIASALAAALGCVAALVLRPRLARKPPERPPLLVDAIGGRDGVLLLLHLSRSDAAAAVETAMRAQCRRGDVTGRVGRRVLVVFFDGAGPVAGASLAERMLRAAQEAWPGDPAELRVGWIWRRADDPVSESLQCASSVLSEARQRPAGTVLRASRCGKVRPNLNPKSGHAVAPGLTLVMGTPS